MGFVPGTVPNDENNGTGFGDDINWSGGVILAPYSAYKNYGDTQLIADYWDAMEAHGLHRTARRVGPDG